MLLASVLAIGIFVFDTINPLQFAVAVLYVVIVLIAASGFGRQGRSNRRRRMRHADGRQLPAGAWPYIQGHCPHTFRHECGCD